MLEVLQVIVFNLKCAEGHGFEEWFASSADYEAKAAARALVCPESAARRISRRGSRRRTSTAARRPRRLQPGRADCRPAPAVSAR